MKINRLITVFAILIVLCRGTVSYAAEVPVVNFSGTGVLEYSNEQSVTDAFKQMVPGVTRDLDIKLSNENESPANFYFATDDIYSLFSYYEEQSGAYDVVVSVGNRTVYDSTVGGYTTNAGDGSGYTGTGGLSELTALNIEGDGLHPNNYLTTLSKGQSTNLRISLTLDGVSNGNQYKNANLQTEGAGNIGLEFAVAYNDVPGTTTVNNVVTTTSARKRNIVTTIEDIFVPLASGVTAVKTGDPAAIGVLTMVGTVGVLGLFLTRRKKGVEGIK